MNKLLEIINNYYRTQNGDRRHERSDDDCELLQSILNSLAEGVIIADLNGKFLFFNPVAEKILGLGSVDVSSAEWSDAYGCYYPDTMQPFPSDLLPLARALRGEESHDTVIYIKNPLRPNGVYISVSGKPLTDDSGSLQGGTVVIRDITDHMLTLNALKDSEERSKAQFAGIPVPTYVWQHRNDDFVLIDFNKAAESFTNNKVKTLLGSKLSELYHHSPEIFDDVYRCYSEQSIISHEMRYRFLSFDQEKFLKVWYAYVPPDLVMVHTEDISKSKAAEKDLRKLYNAVEQTGDTVFITDKKGIIEYVNSAFEETTGYNRFEALGRTPAILKSGMHEPGFYENLWNTVREGKAYRGTIINKKKNGELYWSEQTITPMKDEDIDDTKYVSVLKDITDLRKQQEQEFQLRLAREVQQRLYKIHIEVPGYDIAASTHSAVETSGDYFDYFLLPDGCLGIVICDVAGHGIGPAIIMSSTRAYMRAFAKVESDPGVLLTWVNKELENDLDDEQYVTMILARLDFEKNRIDYASAGHLPFYVVNHVGEVRHTMESMSIPLGIMKDYEFTTSDRVDLMKDDILLFLTDGIMEAENIDDDQFGLEGALDVVKSNLKSSAAEIMQHLYRQVREFMGSRPQEDDITSIVCKVK
ncbi:SpoIIE family protein phosphatase [candidate division KSB1 bacterium]|nr:SpoIIE family protein phosphatase [candidate division KSB1 bacterium]